MVWLAWAGCGEILQVERDGADDVTGLAIGGVRFSRTPHIDV